MRVFGKISELTSVELRADTFVLSIAPNSATTYTADRDLEMPPGDADETLVGAAATQTLTNKSISGATNTLSAIPYSALVLTGTIVNADISASAAIDASKIADGSVTSTEFQYLGGVTSDIQTQINNAVSGAQPLDADLTAIAALATTGMAARTAADTWALRTITGTSNRITVSNGDGVSGNPTLDIGTDVVTLTGTQTLTGKTIDGDDNTLSDISISSLKTVLGDANKVIRRDASGAVVSDNSIPNSSALMTIDSTQVVTNKTLTANLVDSYLDFNDEASATSPAASTKRLFAKTDGMYIRDSSGNEIKIGAGSGAGRNYLEDWFDGTKAIGTVENSVGDTLSSSTRSNPTQWGASNTSLLTVTNTTSSPLRQTSSILLDSVAAGAAFIETPLFDLDLEDEGEAVYVSFDVGAVVTSGDYDVVMVRYNSSNVLQERIVIAGTASSGTPASAVIPTGAATNFKGFFVSGSTTTDKYALRFRRLSASDTTDVKIDTLLVGPQQQLVGAAITDWQSYTPTVSGFGAITSSSFEYKQVGDSIYISGRFIAGTTTASAALISLPKTAASLTYSKTVGLMYRNISTATATKRYIAWMNTADLENVRFSSDEYALSIAPLSTQNGSTLASSGNEITVEIGPIKIEGWSSNTTMANRALQTYGSDDGTSDVFGINGALVPNQGYAAGTTGRVFTLPDEIQSTDDLVLEFNRAGYGWQHMTDMYPFFGGNNSTTGAYYGSRMYVSGVRQITVEFGNYGTRVESTGYVNGAERWADIYALGGRFRVKKTSGGALVGYPVGARNIVGDTTGTAVPTGMIGEVIRGTISNISTPNITVTNIATLTLNKGNYTVYGKAQFVPTSVSAWDLAQISISTTSASEHAKSTVRDSRPLNTISSLPGFSVRDLDITSDNTVVYLTGYVDFAGTSVSTAAAGTDFYAIRR